MSSHRNRLRYHPLDLQPTTNKPVYTIFDYNAEELTERKEISEEACKKYHKNGNITWINVDGLRKEDIERLSAHYDVHPLVAEDILSLNERPKMEEIGDVIFAVLPQMFFNETTGSVELEQVSIVLGKDFVLSFQEEATRDVFDPIRRHLREKDSKTRSRSSDYLCYQLLDVIVDSYFDVLEKLAENLETLEDSLILRQTNRQLAEISALRGDVTLIRRAVLPVRELVAHFVRSDSELLEERHEKYFRDVLDHTIQANDFVENHRDMLMNLQDLYLNQINLRMNEVMKVFTLLATLMAPATVIGGIFGMNFEHMPLLKARYGFDIAVSAMIVIPVLMVIWFKRRGWF